MSYFWGCPKPFSTAPNVFCIGNNEIPHRPNNLRSSLNDCSLQKCHLSLQPMQRRHSMCYLYHPQSQSCQTKCRSCHKKCKVACWCCLNDWQPFHAFTQADCISGNASSIDYGSLAAVLLTSCKLVKITTIKKGTFFGLVLLHQYWCYNISIS